MTEKKLEIKTLDFPFDNSEPRVIKSRSAGVTMIKMAGEYWTLFNPKEESFESFYDENVNG
jgi:hypothetical protein